MDNANRKPRPKSSPVYSRYEHKQPKGPAKPWAPEMNDRAATFIQFLKESAAKEDLQNFMMDLYRNVESQKVSETKARIENELKSDQNRVRDFHNSGNIEPLLANTLNMYETERTFARGIQATQKHLVRTLDDRVEEINRLLAGIGGFSSQLRSSFARSTVVFLEQEDPDYGYRERLIFSINLPAFEILMGKARRGEDIGADADDPRSPVQLTWDFAVNTLARLIEESGLKPKYCKNDRNYGRFVMKQDLGTYSSIPDEYFSFTLDYNTPERIKEMTITYNKLFKEYEGRVNRLEKRLHRNKFNAGSNRYKKLEKLYFDAKYERDFFVSTVPDPNQLEEGLLFLIEVSTLNDYHIVKDRMQSIMTKFILHLSSVAAKDAKLSADLRFDLRKVEDMNRAPDDEDDHYTADDLDGVPEYEIDEGALRPVKKSAS